jgi:hypothetical protein
MFDYLPKQLYTYSYVATHFTLFALSILLATGLSVLVNKYIETPSVILANKIGAKFKKQ